MSKSLRLSGCYDIDMKTIVLLLFVNDTVPALRLTFL